MPARLLVLTLLVLFLVDRPRGAVHSARIPDLRQLVLAEMAKYVRPCVQPTTTSRVFTRCYDTHSSIHAHWAAYRLARHGVAIPAAIESWRALETSKLNNELRYMRYPYAASWFLRLAIEYEKWAILVGAPDPYRLRTFGDTMASWLLSYYDRVAIDPFRTEYHNPAWALYHLHSYYAFTKDRARRDRVQKKIRASFFVIVRKLDFRADINSRGFFSVFGNWLYVLARTQTRADFQRFLSWQNPILDAHLEVNKVSSVHSYGLVWSRMWALRALADTTPELVARRRYEQAFDRHLVAGLQRHVRYRGNFAAYDHWVPQFAVYAMTEASEVDG